MFRSIFALPFTLHYSRNVNWKSGWAWYAQLMLANVTKRISPSMRTSTPTTTIIIKRTTIASGAGRNG
jgi:hypothetical protein